MAKPESEKPRHVEITINGVDNEGEQYWWCGFDKVEGTFRGIPKKPNVNQPSKTIETSQK